MIEFLRDLRDFMKERKKWWLTPIILVLIFIGLIIVFVGGTPFLPVLYTIF